MVEKVAAPEIAVGITLNADAEGQRELVIEMGGGAMVLGPDLVNALEHVLTGEVAPTKQLQEITKEVAQSVSSKGSKKGKLLVN